MNVCCSRKVNLGLLSLILVFCLSFPVAARANSTTVSWLSGTFTGSEAMFGVDGSWQDYSWQLMFLPDLPDMSGTWYCDEYLFCENSGSAVITGGHGRGAFWSSNGTQFAEFTGKVLGGWVTWQRYDTADNGYYDYWEFFMSVRGVWSNGWVTTGTATAWETSGRPLTQLDITTTTPEPATLTLIGVGIAGVYMRIRRR